MCFYYYQLLFNKYIFQGFESISYSQILFTENRKKQNSLFFSLDRKNDKKDFIN